MGATVVADGALPPALKLPAADVPRRSQQTGLAASLGPVLAEIYQASQHKGEP